MSGPLRLGEGNLADYLRKSGLLEDGAEVRVEAAGDGNINWVRRARSPDGRRSWIVKQARPALERFPEYRVTTERIVFEARFYEQVRRLDREGVCPRVLHFDPEARVLVLEDLGAAPRLDHVLAAGGDGRPAAARLGRFLGAVHAGTRAADLAARFRNDEMRALHGDHIFSLPFQPNEFPLPVALRERAKRLWLDSELAAIAAEAHARYLSPTGTLVHGDVQAGNVLLGAEGARLLDAEIAHVGDPAFDLGTLAAHLLLPAAARGAPADAVPALDACWESYRTAHGTAHADAAVASFREAARYAGIEILRRTIGAARVAAVEEPAAGLRALALGERLARHPVASPAELAG